MTETPKILHVEDDADIREIAMMALEMVGGLTVVQCASGAEALERVQQELPDLFLLDVMMPGMSGDETLAALREIDGFRDTPAIFMTAKAQHSEGERLRELGAKGVITKPFDPMSLADEVLEIWRQG